VEWVEATGRSLEEAKAKALARLGVAEEDAEWEVVEPPRAKFFGMIRSEARVRARVRPAELVVARGTRRRERRRPGGVVGARSEGRSGDVGESPASADEAVDASRTDKDKIRQTVGSKRSGGAERARKRRRPQKLSRDQVGRATGLSDALGGSGAGDIGVPHGNIAEDRKDGSLDSGEILDAASGFLRGVISILEVDAEISVETGDGPPRMELVGEGLGFLIGPRGSTLEALEEVTKLAVRRRCGEDGGLGLDIGGYRQRRRQALEEFAHRVANEVLSTGVAQVLEPMSAADRKVVHDAIAPLEGVTTRSEGEEPFRRVVVCRV
jgi:spoIIIJ-associated protein